MLLFPYLSVAAQRDSTRSSGRNRGNVTSDTVWGALDGSVRATSGEWLVGVEVVAVDNASVRTRTESGGAFRIDSVTAGPHLIRFRRIGVEPLTVSVVIAPNTTTSVDVILEPMPVELARVTVQARNGEVLRLPRGVADRIRNGSGRYITSAQIAAQKPMVTGDLLRRVAGLQVVGWSGEESVFNTRGVSGFSDHVDRQGKHVTGATCSAGMAVFVDGSPVDGIGEAGGNVDIVLPNEIEAIEIYKDATEIPADLKQSPCGAIYIWTKD